jgi:hypothetical protein
MISQAKINANRRNAKQSTGPRSIAGKNRSRFNALKHGMKAATDVLPTEDPAAFQERLDIVTGGLKPRDDFEQLLCDSAARYSWLFDRADQFHTARQAARINDAPNRAQEEVLALGRRLFRDPAAPPGFYGMGATSSFASTSWSGKADEPDDPARLLVRLESTAAGCQWLINRWAELGALLHADRPWQSFDKFKAIRLLGKQPLDAPDDLNVARVFLATWALDPKRKKYPFAELGSELGGSMMDAFQERIEGRLFQILDENDTTKAREFLTQLVGGAITRLKAKRDELAARNPVDVANRAFDDSPEAERLWRYAISADRGMHRQIDRLLKLRRAEAALGAGETAGTDHQPEPDPSGEPWELTAIHGHDHGNGTSDQYLGNGASNGVAHMHSESPDDAPAAHPHANPESAINAAHHGGIGAMQPAGATHPNGATGNVARNGEVTAAPAPCAQNSPNEPTRPGARNGEVTTAPTPCAQNSPNEPTRPGARNGEVTAAPAPCARNSPNEPTGGAATMTGGPRTFDRPAEQDETTTA